MELTTHNPCTTRATRSDRALALRDPERVLRRATVDVVMKTWSFDTLLLETSATTSMETAPLSMERNMAEHRDTKVKNDMAGTVVDNDSDTTF